MPRHARRERAALAHLLTEAGPDAPLLIPGWTARDLAAHLVVRERRPAGLGIVVKPLAGHLESVRLKVRERPWDTLVATFASGPGVGPFALPMMDETLNVIEFFVHAEDIRRAREGWEPQPLDAGLDEAIWKRLTKLARVLTRACPVGLVLQHPDGRIAVARRGMPAVTVTGDAGELTMFVYGRKDAARVKIEGVPEAVAAVEAAPLGL
jgi:uncharacterized protein (TIGR03085 family)